MPLKGKASSSKDSFEYLHNTFSQKQKKLNDKFEEIATEDGLYNSYE